MIASGKSPKELAYQVFDTHDASVREKAAFSGVRAPFGAWLTQLIARAHQNVVIVALANKLVRRRGQSCRRMNPIGAQCQ
jgi:hypothetical protein